MLEIEEKIVSLFVCSFMIEVVKIQNQIVSLHPSAPPIFTGVVKSEVFDIIKPPGVS